MADTKISALTIAGSVGLSDMVHVVQDAELRKATFLQVKNRLLRDDVITAAMIQADAVTSAKLADNSIQAGKFVAGTITTAEIAAGAVENENIADDAADDTKAGDHVAQFYRRQGGDAADWGSTGNGGVNTYTPGAVRVQFGVWLDLVSPAAASGSFTITFPVAFSDQPLVFLTQYGGSATVAARKAAGDGSSVDVHWETIAGGTLSAIVVIWLAIGPE